MTTRDDEGAWGPLINLGPLVNTEETTAVRRFPPITRSSTPTPRGKVGTETRICGGSTRRTLEEARQVGRSANLGTCSHPELTIRGISLPVRLGCSADERLDPQPVEVDLTIRFETPPRGMVTDRLEDTVCYDGLVSAIKQVVTNREFSLVEYLAKEIFDSLRNIVESEHQLRVTVRKVSPPIPEITKGAEFTVSD